MKKLLFSFIFFSSFISISQIPVASNNDSISMKDLKDLVSQLNIKTDSLENHLSYIKENDYKSFEVIDQVTNYYENAWIKLLFLITILGGITGILLPIYFSRAQKKELQINKDEFKDYVDKNVSAIESKILEFNKNEIQKTKTDIDFETQKKIDQLYGMTFFLQGQHLSSKEYTDLAIKNFIWSMSYQLKSNKLKNVNSCLESIIKNLTNVKRANILSTTKINLEKVLLKLSKLENPLIELDKIKKIRELLSSIE